MQEYSSISVSSYDAASLADKLTEKSGEGWDVVAIVPAGTNVTAYLRRESTAAAVTAGEPESETAAASTSEPAASDVWAATAGATAAAAAEPEPAPVEEPAGWAVAPEPASPAPADTGYSAEPTLPSYEPTTVVTPAPEPEPEPEPEPVQQAAAAAAPAGWYADPSNRYELRYWDGAQWTEHVSRAGQQYTDPPVA